MKKNLLILTVLAAAAFAVTGCSKAVRTPSTRSRTTPAAHVDTSKPTSAAQSAEPAAKSAVDTTKNSDYFGG